MSDFVQGDLSSRAARIISTLLNDRHSNKQRGCVLSETKPEAVGKGSLLAIQKERKKLYRSKHRCVQLPLLDEHHQCTRHRVCVCKHGVFSCVSQQICIFTRFASQKRWIMLLLCIVPLQNVISIYISLNMHTCVMAMLTWPSRRLSSDVYICIDTHTFSVLITLAILIKKLRLQPSKNHEFPNFTAICANLALLQWVSP